MNPKPILITKELDKQGPLPIQLPQNPKKVVLNSRQDYIDSLRNGKKYLIQFGGNIYCIDALKYALNLSIKT